MRRDDHQRVKETVKGPGKAAAVRFDFKLMLTMRTEISSGGERAREGERENEREREGERDEPTEVNYKNSPLESFSSRSKYKHRTSLLQK